mmetsp:Transcript_32391/g.102934  ORF Transcript_32391/g.102934 Transcript_32391/m.102934 type:complete len:243 (+) Transcript_32391:802-1530(+)
MGHSSGRAVSVAMSRVNSSKLSSPLRSRSTSLMSLRTYLGSWFRFILATSLSTSFTLSELSPFTSAMRHCALRNRVIWSSPSRACRASAMSALRPSNHMEKFPSSGTTMSRLRPFSHTSDSDRSVAPSSALRLPRLLPAMEKADVCCPCITRVTCARFTIASESFLNKLCVAQWRCQCPSASSSQNSRRRGCPRQKPPCEMRTSSFAFAWPDASAISIAFAASASLASTCAAMMAPSLERPA